MAVYQILYWKHIPAQVKAFEVGRKALSRPMPPQFQEEIDRLAMVEGLTGTDEYLQHWHWSEKLERPGSPEEVLAAVSNALEDTFRLPST